LPLGYRHLLLLFLYIRRLLFQKAEWAALGRRCSLLLIHLL